jgi:quercetin dioxygenase-like cupin family protein
VAKRALLTALVVGTLLLDGVVSAQTPERRLALDNDSVRVVLLTYQPGAGTGRHLGLEPELGIVLEGEVTVETPKGVETFKAGSAYWIPSLTPHDVRNETDRPAKVWDMLIKRCE